MSEIQAGRESARQQPSQGQKPEKNFLERFGDFILQKERLATERADMVKIFDQQKAELAATLGRWNSERTDVFNQNINARKQLLGEIRYVISRVESETGGFQDRDMIGATEHVYEQLEKKMTSTHENMNFRNPEYVEHALKNLRAMEKAINDLKPKAAEVPKPVANPQAVPVNGPVVTAVAQNTVDTMPLSSPPPAEAPKAPAKAPEKAPEYEAAVTANRVRFRTISLKDEWKRVNTGDKLTVIPGESAFSADEKTEFFKVRHPKLGVGFVAKDYLTGAPAAPTMTTPARKPAADPAAILEGRTNTDKPGLAAAPTAQASPEIDPSNSRTVEYNGKSFTFEPKDKPTSVTVDGVRYKWEFLPNKGTPIFHVKEAGDRFNQSIWLKPDLSGITSVSGETKTVPTAAATEYRSASTTSKSLPENAPTMRNTWAESPRYVEFTPSASPRETELLGKITGQWFEVRYDPAESGTRQRALHLYKNGTKVHSAPASLGNEVALNNMLSAIPYILDPSLAKREQADQERTANARRAENAARAQDTRETEKDWKSLAELLPNSKDGLKMMGDLKIDPKNVETFQRAEKAGLTFAWDGSRSNGINVLGAKMERVAHVQYYMRENWQEELVSKVRAVLEAKPANPESAETGKRVPLAQTINLIGESAQRNGGSTSPTWSKELALDSNADKDLIGLLQKAKAGSFGFREVAGTGLDFGIVKPGVPFSSFIDKPIPVTNNPRWKDDIANVLKSNLT